MFIEMIYFNHGVNLSIIKRRTQSCCLKIFRRTKPWRSRNGHFLGRYRRTPFCQYLEFLSGHYGRWTDPDPCLWVPCHGKKCQSSRENQDVSWLQGSQRVQRLSGNGILSWRHGPLPIGRTWLWPHEGKYDFLTRVLEITPTFVQQKFDQGKEK